MKKRAHLIWGLILGAIGVLGAIKTLLELSTGSEFSLQRVAFYIGETAFSVYIGVCGGFLLTAGLMLIANLVVGEDKADKYLAVPLVILGGAVTLYLTGVFLFDTGGSSYESLDAIGRGFTALLGLAAIAGTIYMFRKSEGSEAKKE